MNESYKSFTDIILTPTPKVFGLKLLPYTLGHAILLKKAKSVFVVGGFDGCSDIQVIRELIFALLVCSTTYDQFNQEVQLGEIFKLITEFVGIVSKAIRDCKDIKSVDGIVNVIANEVELFTEYLRQGTSTPEIIPKEKDDSDFAPNPIEFEQAMMSALMAECNFSRNECLNLPLTETLSAYLLLGYNRGVIDLESREVWELKQSLKKK